LLLSPILRASGRNDLDARHAELDNTDYTFSRRSFGVAGTVDLAHVPGSTHKNDSRGGPNEVRWCV